jgi:hypothetical protein
MGVTATQDSTFDRRELGAQVTDQCQPEPLSIDRHSGWECSDRIAEITCRRGGPYVGISAIGTTSNYLRTPCRRRDICCNSLRGGGLRADCANFALVPPTKSPESVGCAGCP